MEAELAELPRVSDPADCARARLRAVGTGCLRFAQAEPGLFRTAFSVPDDLRNAASPARAGSSGLTPFQLLAAALDELVEAGVLPRERRPGAEFLAWSAVHGLGMLLIDGSLRSLDRAQAQDIGRRLLDMVQQGLQRADGTGVPGAGRAGETRSAGLTGGGGQSVFLQGRAVARLPGCLRPTPLGLREDFADECHRRTGPEQRGVHLALQAAEPAGGAQAWCGRAGLHGRTGGRASGAGARGG